MRPAHGLSVVVPIIGMDTQEFSHMVTRTVTRAAPIRSAKYMITNKNKSFVKSICKKKKSKMSSFFKNLTFLVD